MLIRRPADIKPSEITAPEIYHQRREFIKGAAALGALAALPLNAGAATKLAGVKKSTYTVDEALTPFKDITTYNNFYEFGTDTASPAVQSRDFVPRPWTVTVDGLVKRAGTTTQILESDRARFLSPTAPYSLDEESSGVIKITSVLGRADGQRS